MLQAWPPFLHYYYYYCSIPASYYHMSATLQTMSTTVVNLQDNRAVFRIFIPLLILNSYSDGDEHSGSVIKNLPHQLNKFLQLKQ